LQKEEEEEEEEDLFEGLDCLVLPQKLIEHNINHARPADQSRMSIIRQQITR
jgi:hypothetical protein